MAFPPGVSATGTTKVSVLSTAPASGSAGSYAPTVSEANAGKDLSAYFKAAGFVISSDQSTVDDTRLSDETTREAYGRTTISLDNLQVIYDPQGAPAATTNEAFDTLVPGSTKYMVIRAGIVSANTFAAGQYVDVYQATFSSRVALYGSGAEGDKHMFQISARLSRVGEHVLVLA